MAELVYNELGTLLFTEEMKKEYTILMPQMAPFHFEILKDALLSEGYKVDLLNTTNPNLIEEGLRYVHNDTCVPALFVIGQLLDAVKNGGYDVNKIALIITQTGGGCRASNYIYLLRKALKKAGFPQVPVISVNISGIEKNPGFSLNGRLISKLLAATLLGDLAMQLYNETRPYEVVEGSTMALVDKWNNNIKEVFFREKYKMKMIKPIIKEMTKEFAELETKNEVLPKVGIVGEIYVKFAPLGNNNLEDFLIKERCEVVIPPMIDFYLFKLDYRDLEIDLYGGKKIKKLGVKAVVSFLERKRNYVRKHLGKNGFHVPDKFNNLKKLVDGYVSHGNRMGEGWLLTAEMIELIKMGVPNIICTQPFGCLPNHISGKGMFKKIKENHPHANIVPIDYDTSASEVNQVNRIKLMLSNAWRNLEQNKK